MSAKTPIRLFAWLLSLLSPGLLAPLAAPAAEAPSKPLTVLFLGDKGHHVPADRAAQLIPVMASRGVEITYTEAMSDLNPQTLAKYDVLMIYANTTRIEPEQEKALLDYVENGGGFAPIHCASYCFLNSPKYIALVGAQFKSHGTGEFDTKVVDADHPIMKGLEPFRTWDETYVHSKHNEKDRHVLQVRDEKGTDEPWTWVRTQGKGRVFYTAYGHDNRTWGHPGFHDLIERGLRWAANKGEVFDGRVRVAAGLKPLRSEDAPAEIPHYLPGRSWGTMGEADQEDAAPGRLGRVDQAHGRAQGAGSPPVRRRARDRQADRAGLGPQGAALGRRDGRLSQQPPARRQRARPDQDLRGHRRRRPGRQVHRLRRQAQHPHQPGLRQRRPGRPPGARHPLPPGHRRRRQGRRPQGPLHRLGDRRHPRRPEQPPLRARQLALRDRRLLRLQRDHRRRAPRVPPGALSVQARRLEAGVPPEHEQQLVGRRPQRGGAPLRLDRQRLPERLPADPQPLLREGPGLDRPAGSCRASPTRTGSSR